MRHHPICLATPTRLATVLLLLSIHKHALCGGRENVIVECSGVLVPLVLLEQLPAGVKLSAGQTWETSRLEGPRPLWPRHEGVFTGLHVIFNLSELGERRSALRV